jgi:hypothetical protein
MRCPGSPREGTDDNVYSREGTFGHAVGSRVLKEDIDTVHSLLGLTDGEFTLDRELADAIQVYVNVCREIMMLGGIKPAIEEEVALSDDVWGTADFACWSADEETLDVVDLKLGRGTYVDETDNEQLQIYAIGVIKKAGRPLRKVKKINLTIVQPRYVGGDPSRTATVTGDELAALEQRVLQAVVATRQPNAPLVAGDHCKFCPAAATCPELRKQALQVAIDLFPTGDALQINSAPDMSLFRTMPADQLAIVLKNLHTVESWIETIREHAFKRAVAGEAVPGHKLVEKIGNRRWLSDEVAAAMLRHYGIDPMEKPALITPAEAERKSRALKPLIAKMVSRPVTGVALVPDQDRRPAVNPVAEFQILPPQN